MCDEFHGFTGDSTGDAPPHITPHTPCRSRMDFKSLGSKLFVAASSCALVASPLWTPVVAGVLGFRALSASNSKADTVDEHHSKRRRYSAFIFCLFFFYLPLRPWKSFYRSSLWKHWLRYLKVGLRGWRPPANQQHVFSVTPHGLFPFSLAFSAISPLREFLGVDRIVVASATSYVPILRHVIQWLGSVDASVSAVNESLRQGRFLQ